MSTGRNEVCPCGSGRKFKHCHGGSAAAHSSVPNTAPLFSEAQRLLQQGDSAQAIPIYRHILTLNSAHADARHYLGMSLCFEGDIDAGLEHIRASLALKPREALYQYNLALWLEETGAMDSAEQQFIRALELAPEYREARVALAKLLLRRRRNVAARMALQEFMQGHPADTECGLLYVEALFRLGEYSALRLAYRELLQHAPTNPALRLHYAEHLQAMGSTQEALEQCDAVLAMQPDNSAALRVRAFLEERRNRLEDADHWARAALALDPNDAATKRLLARIQRRRGDMQAALILLDSVEVARLPLPEQGQHYLERGAVLDKLTRYDEAFESFRLANEAERCHLEQESGEPFYDQDKIARYFESLKRFFTRARIAELARFSPPPVGPQPVFIVGFPRSGTTLIEQMLGAHPNLQAGDELSALHLLEVSAAARLASRRPYPDCLDDILQPHRHEALREFRDAYLAMAYEAGAITAATQRFTDKMPLNETRLGLIRLLFPRAPVVHVIRHPLDVVLSCYANELLHGKNCALRLETAAFHYLQVMDLVEHQIAELGLQYRRLRYEDLLNDPEAELRALLEFVGEPWDASCLAFHASGRLARTASYAQVAQPLYRTSRERWHHYRQQLTPAIDILTPLIGRLGYQLD